MLYKKLILEGSQQVYFTSDTHYSHKNICRGTSTWDDIHSSTRNFVTVEDMNKALIGGINNRVQEDDWLVHLGDWSFGGEQEIEKLRESVNCKNVILVLGNHDHHIATKEVHQDLFESVHSYLELRISSSRFGKKVYNLCHFPMAVWNKAHHGRYMLHGHCHNSYQGEGKSLDVGVDSAKEKLGVYQPFSQQDIEDFMNHREFAQKSHHNENTN